MEYNNGDVYDEYWKDNLKEGEGIMINNDKSEFKGKWINEKIYKGKGKHLIKEIGFMKVNMHFNGNEKNL